MKLEYYVFFSSDAFFSACSLASNQALLFSGRPIPRFHVISTPNNQLFPLLVHLIMFSESSRMKFFSFKTPTQDPHAWSHYDAAGVRSLDNDIHDCDLGPSLRFHIKSTDQPANYKFKAPNA
jgi:hypothetical protein